MLKEFEKFLSAQDKAEKTILSYVNDLKHFQRWFDRDLTEITPIDVREYKADLVKRRSAASSVNRRIASLRSFCGWMLATKRIAADPTSAVRYVREIKPAPRWLDRKEIYALVRSAQELVQRATYRGMDSVMWESIRDQSAAMLMLHCGMRIGEVADLKMGDVKIGLRSGEVVVRHGKGAKTRTIPMNKDARSAWLAWIAVRPSVEHDAAFVSRYKDPLSRRSLDYAIKRIATHAGVKATPHTLRHTFAKSLLDQGVSLDKVALLLGHDSLTTTSRYTTPSASDLAAAVEGIAWSD